MKEYKSVQEWLDEAKQRFGEDALQWKFVCPACGHINCGQEFIDKGVTNDANEAVNKAYCECIGRYIGKGSPKKGDDSGCNWVAFGLFGTMGRGVKVANGDKMTEAFAFADTKETNQ